MIFMEATIMSAIIFLDHVMWTPVEGPDSDLTSAYNPPPGNKA